MDTLYHEIILEEARHPRNFGTLDAPDVIVEETNASCGDKVRICVTFYPDSLQIQELKWEGSGCVISMAAMSVVSELVLGKTVAEVAVLGKEKLEQELGLESIVAGRVNCLLLGLKAVQKGVAGKMSY